MEPFSLSSIRQDCAHSRGVFCPAFVWSRCLQEIANDYVIDSKTSQYFPVIYVSITLPDPFVSVRLTSSPGSALQFDYFWTLGSHLIPINETVAVSAACCGLCPAFAVVSALKVALFLFASRCRWRCPTRPFPCSSGALSCKWSSRGRCRCDQRHRDCRLPDAAC